jgi:hypothetical protein
VRTLLNRLKRIPKYCSFLRQENGYRLLYEDGGKIIVE